MGTKSLYDRDFFEWSQHNARLLEEGRIQEADLAHIAEEIADMGKRDRRAASSRMRVLLTHLLKWRLQCEKRTPSWRETIIEQRSALEDIFEDSPSLNGYVLEHIDEIYQRARRNASKEMGLLGGLPEMCPWRMVEVLDPDFWPGDPAK